MNDLNTTTTATAEVLTEGVHPFTAAGLGKAPFRFAGMVDQEINAGGERVLGTVNGCTMTTKPGGTCAFCGTYIVEMYRIVSACGNKFTVGCECVKKSGQAKLIAAVKVAANKVRKAKTADRNAAKIAAAEAALPTAAPVLANLPHPSAYFAAQGRTLLNWVEFMLTSAGTTGKVKAAGVILKAMKAAA